MSHRPKSFFWAAGHDDGSTWYRGSLPARYMTARGYDAACFRQSAASFVAGADLIIGQRVSREGPTALWQQWARQGRRLAFDLDDDLWAFPPENEAARTEYGGAGGQRLLDNVRAASVVTTVTPALAEVAQRVAPGVPTVVVPNGLPAAWLAHRRPRRERVVLGWAGSQLTVPDLRTLLPVLRRFLAGRHEVELHLVGVGYQPIPEVADLPNVRITPWVSGVEQYLRVIDFDVWVAPWRPLRMNEHRYWSKAMEAGFLGIPLLSSPVGAYRDVPGPHPANPHAWLSHLAALVTDAERREHFGTTGREWACQFVMEDVVRRWLALVKEGTS